MVVVTLATTKKNCVLNSPLVCRMAGVNGDRKGKKDDNGIGTAIDFMLSNAKLVLGVGGAAMLGIATLAVKRVSMTIPPLLLSVSMAICD